MATLFRIVFGLAMLVAVWVCFQICFISDAQGGPGFFVQAWHESPIATLIMIPILLIVGFLVLKK